TRSPLPTNAQTCLPSVEGEGDAKFPSSERATLLPVPIVFFHSSLPSVLAQISSRLVLSAATEVRKMWSPQMTGVAPAWPGSGSFHTTFSVFVHLVGRSVS